MKPNITLIFLIFLGVVLGCQSSNDSGSYDLSQPNTAKTLVAAPTTTPQSPAELLSAAIVLLGKTNDYTAREEAIRYLRAVPKNAKEYRESQRLLKIENRKQAEIHTLNVTERAKPTTRNNPSKTPLQTETTDDSTSLPNTASDDEYHLGPRGGCYTYTSGGKKRYVDRSLCGSGNAVGYSARNSYSSEPISNPSSSSGFIRGPRGGCYTYSASGRKRYVDRSLCN